MTILEMIKEWRRGCSDSVDDPCECHQCTNGLIDAIERKLTSSGITDLMREAGLKNISALSKASGVSNESIRRVINLEFNRVTSRTMNSLALFFGVKYEHLMPIDHPLIFALDHGFTERQLLVLELRVNKVMTFTGISKIIGVSKSAIRDNYINAIIKVDALIKELK